MATDQDALRELLGPSADMPAPPSPDDRDDSGETTGGIIRATPDARQFSPAQKAQVLAQQILFSSFRPCFLWVFLYPR